MSMVETASRAMNKAMDMMPRSRRHSAHNLARRLGWFSIGLGLIEIAAPHRVSRFLGFRGGESLIAFFGLREVATGVAILSSRNPEALVWGRVAGDAFDLSALAAGFMASRRKSLAGVALGSVAMITVIRSDLRSNLVRRFCPRAWPHTAITATESGLPKAAAQMRGAAKSTLLAPAGRHAAQLRRPKGRRPAGAARVRPENRQRFSGHDARQYESLELSLPRKRAG